MKCISCGNIVPAHRRDCPSCGADNGFPNVRLANDAAERKALDDRYASALASAEARGAERNIFAFGEAVTNSKVVISRPLSIVQQLIDDEKFSYVSFQRQVEAGMRDPADNIYDRVRGQYESALYPNFARDVVFGSLTLRDRGIASYGAYDLVLRSPMVASRTSVFEENPHVFVERHRLLGNQPITAGYRADWERRGVLAATKYQPDITFATKPNQFPDILQKDVGGTADADFIEAHVFGSINRNAIECIVGPQPRIRHDRIIWRALIERLEKVGVRAVTL